MPPPDETLDPLIDAQQLDEIELLLDLIEIGTRSRRHLTPSEVDAALRLGPSTAPLDGTRGR